MSTQKSFRDALSGNVMRFTTTSAQSSGALLVIDAQYAPHSHQPPRHYHPRQREHFVIESGSLTVLLGDEQRVYQAGESFDVPAGTPHAMWNAEDSVTHVTWEVRPALKTQTFFETVWGLAQDGKTGKSGSPNLLQAAVLMTAYADEFRLVSPPRPVQIVLFGLLAPIGRLLGYRARYPEYSG